jgi:hypothetical protein
VDLNGQVNISDFNILSANFGQSVSKGWDQGDLTYSGQVNIGDFNLLSANFGQSDAGSAVAVSAADWAAVAAFGVSHGDTSAVPEPTATGLLLAGAAAMLIRCRRYVS